MPIMKDHHLGHQVLKNQIKGNNMNSETKGNYLVFGGIMILAILVVWDGYYHVFAKRLSEQQPVGQAELISAYNLIDTQIKRIADLSDQLSKANADDLRRFNENADLIKENDILSKKLAKTVVSSADGKKEFDPFDTLHPNADKAQTLLDASFSHISGLWLDASLDREWDQRDALQAIWDDLDNARLKLKKFRAAKEPAAHSFKLESTPKQPWEK